MNEDEIYRLKHKLPKVPGINGREDYLNSAVLVLLITIEGEYHFLFQKRSEKIRQGGEICFPGGKYDSEMDKTTKDTALRETEEEMGILPSAVTIIGALDLIIAPMGAIVEPFLGITDDINIDALHLNPNEVQRAFTLPLSFFKNHEPEIYKTQVKVHPSYINEKGEKVTLFPTESLGLGEYYTKPWGRGQNTILVYRTKEGIIWGLTAKIIYDVIKRLNA